MSGSSRPPREGAHVNPGVVATGTDAWGRKPSPVMNAWVEEGV